jgi:hypothetical protein
VLLTGVFSVFLSHLKGSILGYMEKGAAPLVGQLREESAGIF